jgi:DNA invertase Pin-like site-specific DNA recombinase
MDGWVNAVIFTSCDRVTRDSDLYAAFATQCALANIKVISLEDEASGKMHLNPHDI